jgi:hypothetical protein
MAIGFRGSAFYERDGVLEISLRSSSISHKKATEAP